VWPGERPWRNLGWRLAGRAKSRRCQIIVQTLRLHKDLRIYRANRNRESRLSRCPPLPFTPLSSSSHISCSNTISPPLGSLPPPIPPASPLDPLLHLLAHSSAPPTLFLNHVKASLLAQSQAPHLPLPHISLPPTSLVRTWAARWILVAGALVDCACT